MSDLGKVLKLLRGNLSLREAAKKSGLSHNYLSIVEKGVDPRTGSPVNPTPDTLKKLSEAYGFPYQDLMVIAGYIDPDPEGLGDGKIELQSAMELSSMERKRRRIPDREVKKEVKEEIEEWKQLLNVEELFADIHLSDDELMKKYSFKYNGKTISESKVKKIISYMKFVSLQDDED